MRDDNGSVIYVAADDVHQRKSEGYTLVAHSDEYERELKEEQRAADRNQERNHKDWLAIKELMLYVAGVGIVICAGVLFVRKYGRQ